MDIDVIELAVRDLPALFKRLQQFLRDQYSSGRRTVLIIDEAQNLGVEALEELRMLSYKRARI